jgi:hypothetical protein
MVSFDPGDVALLIGTAFVAVGMIVSAIINRMCAHQWEPAGERVRHKEMYLDMVTKDCLRQPVRCAKCGKYSYFEVS